MTLLPPTQLRKVRPLPAFPSPSANLTQLINRFQPSPETVVLFLAMLIGGGTGMGVVTFHYLIQLVHNLMLENLMGLIGVWGGWTLACVPTLGGLIVGLMRWRTQDFGPGLSSLIAVSQGREVKRQLRPVTKMIAAAVSLGSGASLGPEGPSVEIGTNFGVLLSDVLQVSQERQRLLLGAGAAAGLAAGFNAPIAGVFFALEVVMGTTSFATSAVSVVLLAAVVAALIAQIGLGSQPAFALPAYQVRSSLELPLYLGLGLGASLISVTYTEAIRLAKAFFAGRVPGFEFLLKIPQPIQPIIGGAIIGTVAFYYPQILGIGYGTVQPMLQDQEFSLNLLLILMVLKLLMTAVCSASGFVGGLFAPAMFLGASFGSAYAKFLALIVPTIVEYMAAPPAYAMVGMAAVLAGSVRAPLTAILMLFELTRDYRIVLPLMAAVGLSVWLVERIKPTFNSNSNLQQIGLAELKDEQVEIVQQISVADAMNSSPKKLPVTLGILEASMEMIRDRTRSALVIDASEKLVGILSLDDINRALSFWENYQNSPPEIQANFSSQTLIDICTTDILYAWQDEPLSEALDRMALRGLHQLPVVARDKPDCILGLLEKEQIALTCNLAATRKALQHYLQVLPTTEIVIGH
ncbi:chloride channel protein [Anabaena cylindrica FACHB-243]|uniref:Cl-channel voltage-gated family protein n=1 Tax=Anabaena cylindrica (strain ATCC 27899 / PCC 7122) TaxID=272123 RepID=K9ZIC7_ANACC|nr:MULTISPECIES: chloride channel protein [Anabaena]AFZ58951.1 Cl- channel voltage-gated family protein [Anabaena cylindrica PCC 7122]MBD2420704.1 chloride channel protein [Anabaena cylindrica FACHB-243]MBY5284398.1 chloride channel protein [Anabaena sp. CCAP 1446/1C]MBY5306685.1 chloride channel protein [Anabaena sp. CCAP 1446/1C]MCM2408402.1 chloride channel protein [Anabaena sp. CCAP 1446/1C]